MSDFFCDHGVFGEIADTYYQNALRLSGAENLKEVFTLYARAAELGHPIAQYNLAMMYSNGESVYVDYQQAVYWYKKSASQNFPPAQFRLGEMYYFAKGGLPRNLAMAVTLIKKSAQHGDPEAQLDLAMLNGTGEGLPKDTGKALLWIARVKEGGHDLALYYQKILAAAQEW